MPTKKQEHSRSEVERFMEILSKRDSGYLRFLVKESGRGTGKEVAAAARELLAERGENEPAQ